MIKTTGMLKEELGAYVNPTAKINRLVKAGELIPIIQGLYETDPAIPGYCLASIIYGPSYLSFEYALAWHALIPEAVYVYTSATFEKKRTKTYTTPFGTYTYRDVPASVYPLGIILRSEGGYGFMIASPEKAICDQLYKTSPRSSRAELETLLFEDLRIDEEQFSQLNFTDLFEISTHYKTKNHKLLQSYLKRSLIS